VAESIRRESNPVPIKDAEHDPLEGIQSSQAGITHQKPYAVTVLLRILA
jgi:hypothetical protein